MSTLNQKELEVVTSKARADKAISSLKGILLGINLDKEVNDREITELKKWSENHRSLINRNPFKEFMTLIEETVSNNIPAKETIEDLFWLCQKYESDSYYYNTVTSDLQILQGICHGILSDGEINEKEVFDLEKWLDKNTHLSTYYPYDEIRSLILSIIADGIIDDEEKLILKAYLNQFVNLESKEISDQIKNETSDINISGHCMYTLAELYPTKIAKSLGINYGRYIFKLSHPHKFTIGEIVMLANLLNIEPDMITKVIYSEMK